MRVLTIAMVWLAACGTPKKVSFTYDNSLFSLASGFSAKEVCSCVFVAGQDEAFCKELTRVSPDVARFKVDREAKEVRSRALGMGMQRAVYQGEGLGCTIVGD